MKAEQKWFVNECRKKRELMITIKSVKERENRRYECIKSKKGYKELIKINKSRINEKWLKEVEEDKNMKKFLKEVGSGKKGNSIKKKIEKED